MAFSTNILYCKSFICLDSTVFSGEFEGYRNYLLIASLTVKEVKSTTGNLLKSSTQLCTFLLISRALDITVLY